MTLDELQERVDTWVGRFKEGYFPPFENLARLTEEVGELSREISHAHGTKRKKPSEDAGTAADEVGDILFVLACLANQLGFRLEDAFAATMSKYETRDADRWTPKDT